MTLLIKIPVFLLIAVFAVASCKKEKEAVTPPPIPANNNKAPLPNAGIDQTIVLPIDSVTLNGSASIDPDGTIISYRWINISGPAQSNIRKPDSSVTIVKTLGTGIYLFELTITDNGGIAAKDTVAITVIIPSVIASPCNIQLIPVGALSIPRYDVAAAAVGNKIFFAGGFINTNDSRVILSSRVDIYDLNTQSWTTAELSEARGAIGVVVVGNKVLFAGGANRWDAPNGGFYDYNGESTRVDIYDVTTNTWSTTEMPEGIVFLHMWYATAVVAGNKAIFSEGHFGIAYIYDVITNSWTYAHLTRDRHDLASASLGNKALIAGGNSEKVDVFDAATNTWTVQSLSESRGLIRGATLNDQAFFAGGFISLGVRSNKVDIYNNTTQSWSVAHLSRKTALAGIAPLGQKLLFFRDKDVDIYDAASNTWSVCGVTESFSYNSLFIAAGGNLYASNAGTVWRVQL